MSKIIVLAAPVFFLMIGLELLWGWAKGRNTYSFSDACNSLGLGSLSQIWAIPATLLRIGIYSALFSTLSRNPDAALWHSLGGWLLALLAYDFCYYWLHRMGHEMAVLWAAHVVHHQSQHYNLSTALRQTSSGLLFGWIFYLPLALIGVPPTLFAAVAMIDLLYQFWVHTEHVPKLGWFDRWFCSPSNHRVHHAVNDAYIDRNYGGILIIWDRLFGSFQEEHEPCVYGTRSPLHSWDPLWANFEVYAALARDSWQARRWRDKLLVWLKPPGWQSAEMALRAPKAVFSLTQVRRFDPPLSRGLRLYAALQFAALLAAITYYLSITTQLTPLPQTLWIVGLTLCFWAHGQMLQHRLSALELLYVETACLATAAATLDWHQALLWLKPLPLLIAVICVLRRERAGGQWTRFGALLASALALGWLGDVLLLSPTGFIAGLLAFLLGHLTYLRLFRLQQPWFPSRWALALTLTLGASMYALLWPDLPGALRVAIGAYVLVISLMAAQALGRAVQLRTADSRWVAIGCLCFMASDGLLSIDRFAMPLPLAPLAVLASYFLAQGLIFHFAKTAPLPPTSAGE